MFAEGDNVIAVHVSEGLKMGTTTFMGGESALGRELLRDLILAYPWLFSPAVGNAGDRHPSLAITIVEDQLRETSLANPPQPPYVWLTGFHYDVMYTAAVADSITSLDFTPDLNNYSGAEVAGRLMVTDIATQRAAWQRAHLIPAIFDALATKRLLSDE